MRGEAYTTTVEGFFTLLKRGINGTFHHVSREHLSRYCDYENRKVSDGQRPKAEREFWKREWGPQQGRFWPSVYGNLEPSSSEWD